MATGLRLPAALRHRRLSPPQERLISQLYAAREKLVPHDQLMDAVFEGAVENDRLLKVVHGTKRAIQGTGWTIENNFGQGYRMKWAKRGRDDEPGTAETIQSLQDDIRDLTVGFYMMQDAMKAALHLPPELLMHPDVWTEEVDADLLETKGITGKIKAVAEEHSLSEPAAFSRYRALKKTRGEN